MDGYQIIDESPIDDGEAAGRQLGREQLRRQTRQSLDDPLLRDDLGQLSETALTSRVIARLETPPNDASRPELDELYPERLDYLRGLAKGAECSLAEAALYDYTAYVREIRQWTATVNPATARGNCSGILFVGPEGVVAGQNEDSLPLEPRPNGYEHRPPHAEAAFEQQHAPPAELVLKRPRSGYIENWGTTNEHGLGFVGAGSCGTWLDEPIVDVWPIKHVPLLRFARNVAELAALYERYRLFNWGRSSELWADVHGGAVMVEHSYRRIGVRPIEHGAIWGTEGYFHQDDMAAFLRERRLTYVQRRGDHAGVGDLQYAADCAVRFCHIGELAHRDFGRGLDHLRHILTDHSPFPRGVCRHGGPDTDPYDQTVTQKSTLFDLTRNRTLVRAWQPWRRFCCEVPEVVTQFPPRPCD